MFEWIKKPKIEVFVRHCHFSEVSQHKMRVPGFSRKGCHENLMKTTDPDRVNITFLLDSYYPMEGKHFVLEQTEYPVIEIKEGSETGSFIKLLDHVSHLKLAPKTMIYFLEDDYLHREGWVDVLLEGFSLPEASYVTLYDHQDKYFLPLYQDLKSKVFHTQTCHWRTTPSTTNTYAMRFETLKRDLDIHYAYSQGRRISDDHGKFIKLGELGQTLISALPGYATHVEKEYLSPCFDWIELQAGRTPCNRID